MKIKALAGRVLVNEIDKGERKIGSIILTDDNGKAEGVRCRWCKVFAIGEGVKGFEPGEWILVKHGNWTRSIRMRDENNEDMELWQVNWPEGVLAASDEPTTTWSGSQTVVGTDVAQLHR